MKVLDHFSMRQDQPPADRALLIRPAADFDDIRNEVDDWNDDEVNNNGENIDGAIRCTSDRCPDVKKDAKDEQCKTVDNIEVQSADEQAKNKRRKLLRKRMQKHAWRAMRTSWKYFRRGMAYYSPGFNFMFTWGINANQAASTSRDASRKYF